MEKEKKANIVIIIGSCVCEWPIFFLFLSNNARERMCAHHNTAEVLPFVGKLIITFAKLSSWAHHLVFYVSHKSTESL